MTCQGSLADFQGNEPGLHSSNSGCRGGNRVLLRSRQGPWSRAKAVTSPWTRCRLGLLAGRWPSKTRKPESVLPRGKARQTPSPDPSFMTQKMHQRSPFSLPRELLKQCALHVALPGLALLQFPAQDLRSSACDQSHSPANSDEGLTISTLHSFLFLAAAPQNLACTRETCALSVSRVREGGRLMNRQTSQGAAAEKRGLANTCNRAGYG